MAVLRHTHPWAGRLLTPLPDDLLRAAVAADDPLWEQVENELVKLGSLAHSQVDLNAVAGQCLTLLETRTKDMRVLAQLLRCLQHPARATPFTTALTLLDAWLAHYWQVAWPASPVQKQKVMISILRRFESVLPRAVENASASELEQLERQALALSERWCQLANDKTALMDELVSSISRVRQRQQAQADRESTPAAAPSHDAASLHVTAPAPASAVEINASDERGWRQTQLNVAALLVERQPDAPVGYRLRRNALWSGITTPPMSTLGNKTPLAPVSPDRVDEYQGALAQADQSLWQRIEQSLVLAPYWFDGHMLSATVATHLGHAAVAHAIADELSVFLQRVPELSDLAFSDGSPFLTRKCHQWLQSSQPAHGGGRRQEGLATEVANCRVEKGINAALALMDERMHRLKAPRDRFYAELVLADLLMEEGMKALAAQHYQHLWQTCQRLALMQWEPEMVGRVEQLAAIRQR
ncbi:type VI secretion system protein TssA [Candidatus Symbiopectobacterium sp. NZEC151]|uniref:type VI secretion system protein TssA n=1 Tax=Candidatus Symbiopectobacterium sp. NZEC151 TaxID=2820470 RepID=UPI0022279D5D|nr:type VI secretion system protein TssA [Candidatus Symbiopectobacterium sp. NZEC151]MCW2473237.1 type VI secretion system protein TssA [Candidatus Symbiopectobacterium sp. NZEC151]